MLNDLRWMIRESRGARARWFFFMSCLAVGVAAVVAVAGLSESMDAGIRSEARKLLSADVVVESHREAPPELDKIIGEEAAALGPVQRLDMTELVSLAAGIGQGGKAGGSTLVELRAVEAGYPLYGKLRLSPEMSLERALGPDTVIVAPELLGKLEVHEGQSILLGGKEFKIVATVLDEPDRLNFSFALGPRVYVSRDGLARAGLLMFGSRARRSALLKMRDGATQAQAQALADAIRARLPGASYYEIESFGEAQPALRASLRRIGQFLGLAGLLSLLIGGVGVAQSVRSWIASRLDAIAILRCLGVTPLEALRLYALQTAALALAGSLVGVAAGTLIQWTAPMLVADLLPEGMVRTWQPLAALRGVGLGVGVSMIFCLPALLGAYRVPPIRVFRRDAEPLPASFWQRAALVLVLSLGVFAAAVVQGGSVYYGSIFVLGTLAVVGVLTLAALALIRVVRLVPRDLGSIWLRHGLARLARPGAATVGAVVALGLGVMIVLSMHIVQATLVRDLAGELPADSPNAFFVDVQTDQWPALKALLEKHGGEHVDSEPIVVARLAGVNGVGIEKLTAKTPKDTPESQRKKWVLTREQRLTYSALLPKGNKIVEGTFWDPADHDGPAQISVERGFARDLGAGIGDTITLDIQGVTLDLKVTSLREVQWRSFNINFFLLVKPGALEKAPQMRIANAKLPPGEGKKVQDQIAQAFSNVTMVQIQEVMRKLLGILRKLGLAVQILGGFTVVAGVAILGGTISATYARRGKEIALLKTLGMTRAGVAAMFVVELGLVGLLAAAIGVAGGTGLAWSVLRLGMDVPWETPWATMGLATGLTVLLAIAAGLSAGIRALLVRPIETIRAD